MKIAQFLLLVLLLLLPTSCQKNIPIKETEISIGESRTNTTEIPTEESKTQKISENTLEKQNLPDGVVEYSVGLAYQSDVEKYGVICATSFYEWRQTGNPDWKGSETNSAYVAYHGNEGSVVFEPLQKTYSAKDREAKWGIDAISISNDTLILAYSDKLNIDKKMEGQWVRQALLDPDRVVNQPILTIGDFNNRLLDTVLTISLDEAAFEIEPGEYRFVFYALVSVDGEVAYRMYYIPFEVIEERPCDAGVSAPAPRSLSKSFKLKFVGEKASTTDR